MQYCTQHDRLYVPPLGQWVPLPHGQLAGTCREVPITEACCDRCVALATTSMAQQFPHLYTGSTRRLERAKLCTSHGSNPWLTSHTALCIHRYACGLPV